MYKNPIINRQKKVNIINNINAKATILYKLFFILVPLNLYNNTMNIDAIVANIALYINTLDVIS